MRPVLLLLCALALASAACGSSSDEPDDTVASSTLAEGTVETSTTATTESTSTVAAYPHGDEIVALVESFLDALYASDQEAMLATLAPNSPSMDFLTYYIGWVDAANFEVTDRRACVFHEGGATGKVTCEITAEDDLMKAARMTEAQVTDSFTVYFSDAGITLVEVSSNEPTEIAAALEWVFETNPELTDYGGACWAMFNGGPTPAGCVDALKKSLEAYVEG